MQINIWTWSYELLGPYLEANLRPIHTYKVDILQHCGTIMPVFPGKQNSDQIKKKCESWKASSPTQVACNDKLRKLSLQGLPSLTIFFERKE